MALRITILLTLLLTLISTLLNGQNCSLISGTKDKNAGTETVGGITNSKDFYSLLIQKTINMQDKSITPIYTFNLVAASKALLSDSLLNTKGTFELLLLDNTILSIDSVTYKNNPLGYCCSLGFSAEIDENKIKLLKGNPVVTLKV